VIVRAFTPNRLAFSTTLSPPTAQSSSRTALSTSSSSLVHHPQIRTTLSLSHPQIRITPRYPQCFIGCACVGRACIIACVYVAGSSEGMGEPARAPERAFTCLAL
jgi:hypothetical protein